MYKCQCCGYEFTAPEPHRERLKVWGCPDYMIALGCPICGGSYEEIRKEQTPDDYATF